ncbi:hypothetical protein MMYC01_204498 [Madurella mycetomatis]|uniref:Uncharacterized protein n=1 Tax=Madurella mycetomatis TaxID=100816 RepID=A0A175W4E1_9PEZI|nr:hypothetical protein MMYC01_204498 [Madurella mycetomatis]
MAGINFILSGALANLVLEVGQQVSESGTNIHRLWAAISGILICVRGILFWGMAPFIHDDDTGCHASAVWETAVDLAEDMSAALEWKVLLPLLSVGVADPQPCDRRPVVEALCQNDEHACLVQAHDGIAETIRVTGEKAVTMHAILKEDLEEKRFWESSWIVKKANSAEPLDGEKSLNGYIWVPVEICSPKMRLRDAGTRLRMQKVLTALSSSHRLAANCSCEVHIHLGHMDGRSWSLGTLKRLATLLWVAEPVLRAIRDPNSPNFNHVYTWGFEMRKHSRLAELVGNPMTHSSSRYAVPVPKACSGISDYQVASTLQARNAVPVKEVKAITEIWKTTSHLELGRLLSGREKKYRRLGFNFSAFGEEDERARRNPRTVEFRIMEGSVEIDLILGWLAICGTIAEAAVVKTDTRFAAALSLLLHQADQAQHKTARNFVETLGARRGREFRELMRALGLSRSNYCGFEEKIIREN